MLIYALENTINHKVYVGQHNGYRLETRWRKDLATAYQVNAHLWHAVKKYGPEAFSRKVLCYCSCQEETDLMERFWIAFYRSLDPRYGYNILAGGRRCPQTQEMRRLISAGLKRWWSKRPWTLRRHHAKVISKAWQEMAPETKSQVKVKLSELMRSRWQKEREELCKAISAAAMGKKHGPRPDAVKQKIRKGLHLYWKRKRFMQTKEQIKKQLQDEVKEIIASALRALENGQSTRLARSQLKEVGRKLKSLEFEFRGGCEW